MVKISACALTRVDTKVHYTNCQALTTILYKCRPYYKSLKEEMNQFPSGSPYQAVLLKVSWCLYTLFVTVPISVGSEVKLVSLGDEVAGIVCV